MIALVTLAYSELECSKYLSYRLPLTTDSSIGLKLSPKSSRKCQPLLSDTWKSIFQLLRMLSHSFFLLNSYEDLHGKIGVSSNFFISLSTIK